MHINIRMPNVIVNKLEKDFSLILVNKLQKIPIVKKMYVSTA